MLSMVNTSSRTKILLDLAQNGELNMRSYLRDYNEKIILDNRINRLKTNKEILGITENIIVEDNGDPS